MNHRLCAAVVPVGFALSAPDVLPDDHTADAELIERGRYLVVIAGARDCHTAGHAESGGEAPVYLPPGEEAAMPVVRWAPPPAG